MLPASALRNFGLCGGFHCAVNRPFSVQTKISADARKQLRAFLFYQQITLRTIFKEL